MENKCLNILLSIERFSELEHNMIADNCCIRVSYSILGLKY